MLERLRPSARDRTVVQVLDASGAVVASSDAPAGQAAMSSLRQTTGAIVVALLLGLPPLGLVVGEVTFLFVGRTLRPVEAMSRQAALITSRNDLERGAAMRIGLPPLSVRLSSP